MGYSISIGELIITPVDQNECSYIHFDVENIKEEKAPLDGLNRVMISYDIFDDFINSVNLKKYFSTDIIQDEKEEYGIFDLSLIQNNPGIALITKKHIDIFTKTKESINSESFPKFFLDLLDWFIFWSKYALLNYEYPIFCNS